MIPSSPYKGLTAFEDSELDALLFFGRERETEIVVANLIASRLTVLYGPSGVGKSSLLSAAVARSLRELPEEPLVVVFSRWADDPAAALAQAVGGENGLLAAALADAQAGRDVYLVLDQADEYFLYHADDGGPGSFAEALPAALRDSQRLNVLVSLREDALAKLDRFTGQIPGLFANTLRLDRLDRAAARSAIVGPVARFNELAGTTVEVEPALLERVLDEVGAGRIEPALGGLGGVDGAEDGTRVEAPYLQLVMQRLWEEEREAGSDVLRAQTLERLGGAQRIVAEHLDRAVASLTVEQKDVAARLFNHLVTPSGTKIAHRLDDLAGFGGVSEDEVRPILSTLGEHRIVRSFEEGGDIRNEIFHDVLAQPVLAWRARHRTERLLEREREEARRRHRRTLIVAVAALLALAAMTAVALYAIDQRGEARDQAREAKGRELLASAASQLLRDPELGVLLAMEAARLDPTPLAERVLREALGSSRLRDVVDLGSPIVALDLDARRGRAAVLGADASVRLVDLSQGRELWKRSAPGARGVAFVDRGRRLVVLGFESAASALDVETGRPTRGPMGISVGQSVQAVVASADGRWLALLTGSRSALLVGLARDRVLRSLEQRGEVTDVAFSPDGRLVATAGRDRTARIWSLPTGRLLHTLRGHGGQVLAVAFGPRGRRLATASADGTTRIWGVPSGSVLAVLGGHTNFVRDVAFAWNGAVATASSDRSARTWGPSGRPAALLRGHTDAVTAVRFTANGARVATVGTDGTLRLWESATLPDLKRTRLPGPDAPSRSARLPDGSARAHVEGAVVRLSGDGGELVLRGHTDVVNSVAFSPDGRRLVTASRDHDALVWDVESGRPVKKLEAHFGEVSDARFSPDGRWIVTAGPITAGVWDAGSGELVQFLYGPTTQLTAAAFGSNAREVLTREQEGTVRRYACRLCGTTEELVAIAAARLRATGRALTADERRRFLEDG